MVGAVRAQRIFFWSLLGTLCLHCLPNPDDLEAEYGSGGGGSGGGGSGGQAVDGGTSDGGLAGADGGRGGNATAGHAQGGGPANGGKAGENAGGADNAGVKGEGGSDEPTAGDTGSGPPIACEDGCAIMYVPFAMATERQFFTINLNVTSGVDLSTSVLTARVRTLQGTTETIQMYASALPNYNFYGSAAVVPVASLAGGGTLTMDLSSTGTWDHTKVMSMGFLIAGAASPDTLQVLVEDITITNSPTVGPWLFTMQSDVNENTNVGDNYNTPNVLFANAYNRVVGARGIWVKPSL